MRVLLFIIATVFSATACNRSDPHTESVALIESLASALEGAKGDCDGMARAVGQFKADHAEAIARHKTLDGTEPAPAEGAAALADRKNTAQKRVEKSLEACEGHVELGKAFAAVFL